MKEFRFEISKKYVRNLIIKAENKEEAFIKIIEFVSYLNEIEGANYSLLLDKITEKNDENVEKNIYYSDEEIEKIVQDL